MGSFTKIEPDAFLYILTDKTDDSYGLLCRDYMQNDRTIEERILAQEQNIIVLNWVAPINDKNDGDYRVFSDDYDTFPYMFGLFSYIITPSNN